MAVTKVIPSALLLLLLAACGDLCGNDPLNTARSPNGAFEAITFVRSCGATTGFSTHVSILKVGQTLPNDPGNILVADGKHPFAVEWQSDSTLHVMGVPGIEPRWVSRQLYGVQVNYSGMSLTEKSTVPEQKR